MNAAHHPKVDAVSAQDARNAASYRLWLARLAAHYRPDDPRTLHQRGRAAIFFEDAFITASMFLACRAARIREELKRTRRRGLRVISGGRC